MCNATASAPEAKLQSTATTDPTTNANATAASAATTTTTDTNKLKTITKSELLAHNTPASAWCSIHNRVLDITSFSTTHPGGDLILLAAGKDATVLFETYHPRSSVGVPESLVKKLQIGIMEEGAFNDSFYSWDSEFYGVLKKRVVQRLEDLGLERRGSHEIWIKALFLLSGFWFSLIQMYLAPTVPSAAIWSITMGIFAALIGTCIQHDGNHGAFAKSKWLNKAAGWTLDMIGASAFTWELQHMLGHHPYTNVLDGVEEGRKEEGVDCPMGEKDQESDPDVFSSFPIMRMHPLHTPQWFHSYQHLYAPLLFAFMTLAKVFQQDFQVATSQRLYHIDGQCRYASAWNRMRFWGMKVITLVYMLGVPIWFHGVGKGVALFFIGHWACGELLATMFIVNHVIEGVSYGRKTGDSKGEAKGGKDNKDNQGVVIKPRTANGDTPMEATQKQAKAALDANSTDQSPSIPTIPYNDWAAVQCQTSVNWAPGSWFWNHFSGGLSHQIEHHLFPSICHTNYYYIQDVVEATCREYGVPYQSERSLWVAYKKMLSHLKFLGRGKSD